MVATTAAATLADRAMASALDARLNPRLDVRNREAAERRACQRAMQDRFQLRVAEGAFALDDDGEQRRYFVTVEGERLTLYFVLTPGYEGLTVRIAYPYDCGPQHPWFSGDVASVAALGKALEAYENQRHDCPQCRHAE